jgi:hypothetical protein
MVFNYNKEKANDFSNEYENHLLRFDYLRKKIGLIRACGET